MTILAAACALIDDLVDSGSFHRSQVSACDYGVLNAGGACCLVARPVRSPLEAHAYGGEERAWGLRVEAFVLDTEDPAVALERVYDMYDALDGAVRSGSTLNTAHRQAKLTDLDHNPDVMFGLGDKDYLLVFATVEVREPA